MQSIQNLITRLKQTDFKDRYPEYDPGDGKRHVLYLSPYANGTGLYRVILPALHLNSNTHSAIISGIMDWDYEKQFSNHQLILDERLVKWAHYIVFPTTMNDLRDMMKYLLRVNSSLRFVMDIDDNYHKLPSLHPNFSQYTKEMKTNLVRNISICNLLTAPNMNLLTYYYERAREYNSQSRVQFSTVYNLLSPYLIEGDHEELPAMEKVRVGMVISKTHFLNVNSFRPILLQLQEKYGDAIEIIIMGWDGKYINKDALRGIKFTYVAPAPFIKYYEAVRRLKLDIAIIPLKNEPEFNRFKTFQRWLEFAAHKVPVVCGDSEVYAPLIRSEENGLIATRSEQWMHHLSALIDNKELRIKLGQAAHDTAWNNFCWSSGQYLPVLKEIYE